MHEARVCPFCHEAFEGEERCPHHDLELVRDDDRERGGALGPARGRGRTRVMAAAIAASIAFFFPFFVDAEGALPPKSALAVALAGAESLWVSFLVPVAVLGTLSAVHEARALRRLRLGLSLSAGIALVAAALALHRGMALAEAGGSTLTPGGGAFALLISLVVMGGGAARLGA